MKRAMFVRQRGGKPPAGLGPWSEVEVGHDAGKASRFGRVHVGLPDVFVTEELGRRGPSLI
jgi:hypothetical protein